MFGYTAVEMVGQPILRLIPTERQDEEDRILARLKSGDRIEHYETIRVTKDGRRIPVSLTISPIRDNSGRLMGASKIARDITEQRAAEESLRQAKDQAEAASRAKDNFLAALSHEMRTPLTPVLMTAAALREDASLSPEVKAQLAMIERNVVLEARLIDDLLDLSRITHGKLALRCEPCDVHAVIRFAVEIIRGEAGEKAIGITAELTARHSRIIGDPARLQQVFWNLLRNAVKFTPKGGHIRISSEDGACEEAAGADRGRICVAVADNGIGLDAAAIKRIFEPFEQAASGQSSHGGLGLGLAIARAIVDMHRGIIHAESAGKGQGSTFTVALPVTKSFEPEPNADPAAPAGNKEYETHRGRPMDLLLVEDDAATMQVLTRFLARDGHQVTCSINLEEARKAAAGRRFDAVISDLGLPDGTGAELMRELRERYGLRGIVLSGYGMAEDLRRSHDAGFAAHLVKPIDVNDLRRALLRLSTTARDPSAV